MPLDSNLVLLNKTDLDSGTDGTGSGTDPTASGGAVVNVEEECEVDLLVFLGQSDTGGEPGDADTLAVIIEAAPDGTNYGRLATFRSVAGSEMPDDETAGDKTLRLAMRARIPRSTDAGVRTVKVRANTTASDTSNWGAYIAVAPAGTARSEWLATAVEA
jgi:hypothetical protein